MTRSNPEANLQRAVATYLTLVLDKDVVWSSIGHGGGGKVRGAQLKAMGLQRGVPDIYIAWTHADAAHRHPDVAVGKTLWIELKSDKGRQSPEQNSFARRVEAIGHRYFVCRTVDDVIDALKISFVPNRSTASR